MDSESSCESSISSDASKEWKKLCSAKKKKQKEMIKKKDHPSTFKKVYSSDTSEEKVEEYPAIFQLNKHRNNGSSASTSTCYIDAGPTNENSDKVDSDQSDTSSDDFNSTYCEEETNSNQPGGDLGNECGHKELFMKFEKWLQGPDGGRKDERCARQCSRQVQLVMLFINKDDPKLLDILSKTMLWNDWLSKFEKERQPGTVKSYLGALHNFYAFLKCEDITNVSDQPEMLTQLIEQMRLWSKSYRRLVKDRFWEKRLDDLNKLKTPAQVKCFDSSDIARSAIKILRDFQESPDKEPNQKDYTTVRDYLLTELCVDNGAGALANMTLAEFNNAQKEDGSFVVKVKNHKTFTSHGPAAVVMSPKIHKWMKIHVCNTRNKLDNADTSPKSCVFLTWTQKKMHSSHVGAQINSIWGKVFGKDCSSGGATAFRKAAVSAVQEQSEELREDWANLMAHNKSTADRHYLLQAKTKSAVKTSKQLSNIIRKERSIFEKEDPNDKQSIPPLGRHKWTADEESDLESLFWMEIGNQSITLEVVRGKIKDHPRFSTMRADVIRYKVRAMFKKGTSELLLPPEETESRDDRLKRIGIVDSETHEMSQMKQ